MSITSDGIKLHHKRKGYCCAFLFGAVELVLSVLLVVSLGAHILFPEQARGALGVATSLSYQGRLTDTSGNPLGGTGTNYCFSFSVFDASSGGNKLWPSGATTTSTLLVTNGVFNASVGPVDAFDFSSNDTTYLHIDVNTIPTTCTGSWEALSPRQQLNAVAYARVAAEVYGSTLQTSSSTNSVLIGPSGGSAGNPTLLYLGKKTSSGSSFTTVGQSCAGYDGTIWYNSATTRALVCEANVVRAISNATTTIDAVMPAGNLDAAATEIANGTLSLAGGNNITLSQAGNAITVRGAYNPAQFTNSTANATMNLLWAGNSNGSGNITMGLTGSTITASAPSGGGGAAIAANAASTVGAGTVVFSNSNGVSFGLNGSTMTASVNAGGGGAQPMRWTQIPAFRFSLSNLTNITAISNVPFFQPFRIDGNLTLSRINWEMSRATSGSNLFSVTAGIYTYVNDTQISLLGSAVGIFSNSATASISGIRRFGMSGFDVSTFGPGGYILGMMFSPANTASMNYSIRGHSGAVQLGAINEGTNNYNTATSYNIFPFLGRLSATTAVFPSSVADSQIRGQFSGASAPINAWIGFNND